MPFRFVCLAVALALGAAPAASAQLAAERYSPFAVGDAWTFAAEAAGVDGTRQCPAREVVGFERTTVVRDSTVDGQPHRVAACDRYDAGGTRLGTNTFLVRVADGEPAAFVTWLAEEGGCGFLFQPSFAGETETGPTDVTVGDETVRVDGLLTRAQRGSTRAEETWQWAFAADVGPVSYLYHYDQARNDGAFCREEALRLVHARVGGVEMGAAPVSRRDGVRSGPTLALEVFPQPARGAVTVVVTGPTAEPRVRLEVVDALGRTVATRDARPGDRTRLGLSALPSGVYFLRARMGEEVATGRIVLR